MNRNLKAFLSKTGFRLLLGCVLLYLLFPFYWALISSLKSESQLMMMPATFLPRNPETGELFLFWGNYSAVLANPVFLRGLVSSTVVALFTTVLALGTGSFAGFALGKLRFKGKKPALYLILAMTMFPQVTVLAGLYSVIRVLHLNTYVGLVLSYMLFTLPFTTWVLTAFFKDLPDEILKAAEVDGATPMQAFRHVLLPLTAPALVTTGLLSFICAWNEYLFALTFTSVDPAARTVPVVISMFTGSVARQEPFGEIMAATIIVTMPIVVLVLFFQKRIVAGLTAGAVKG